MARPKSAPIYYRVAAARLTTSSQIEATGENSSGEVELVLIRDEERLWPGVGSDHTDRKVETLLRHLLETNVRQANGPRTVGVR